MLMSYVCDMDGVIYHGGRLIPSALEFVQRLQSRGHKFLFLTNNSHWTALGTLQTGPAEAFMVGDRMDTDIIAGTEAGMKTILVLSGVTTRELIETYPYRPTHIFEDVGHIPVAELG